MDQDFSFLAIVLDSIVDLTLCSTPVVFKKLITYIDSAMYRIFLPGPSNSSRPS